MYKNIETKDVLFFLFQLHGSTGTSVILDRVSLQAEETFTYELNTYPEFITKSGSKLIRGHSEISKKYDIPSNLLKLGNSNESAFLTLKLVEIIGEDAFMGTSLRHIKIPKVREIKYYAFTECKQLTGAELSEDLERIENEAFNDCRRLRRIAMPLKHNLFERCDVFENCESLSQVDLVGGIHETISLLLLESWRNEMKDEMKDNLLKINKQVSSISDFLHKKKS